MTAFNGDSPCGSWILTVEDLAPGDSGTINEWCIVATIGPEDQDVPAAGGPAIAALILLMLASLGILVWNSSTRQS